MAEMYSTPAPDDDDQSPEGDDLGMEVDNPTEGEAQTALLPTEFFQGKDLQPGKTCKVRIERVLEGQVEVTYVPHEAEVGEEEEGPSDTEMSGYMEA
jgi:hypothetical protein